MDESRERKHVGVQKGYDLWSEIYDEEKNPLVLLEEPVVRRWLAKVGDARVADVGCGTGRHSIWLAQTGAQVDAFDVSDGMLARARSKPDCASIQFHHHCLPEPLPAGDAIYDVVLLTLVADHLGDLAACYRELRRVLKPGGMFVFTVLHPAMNLLGLTARFSDPRDGAEVRVEAYQHTFGDYVLAALKSGFCIEEIVERAADAELVAQTDRAEKYLGWPMLLAMRMSKTSATQDS